jgi:hypothetical protein
MYSNDIGWARPALQCMLNAYFASPGEKPYLGGILPKDVPGT